jgi:tRNA(Ile)-lysidine synthetase-like protein
MLHALHELMPGMGFRLEVLHVNHLVREASALADSELVRSECERLGLQFHYREIEPLSRKPTGKTTEEYFRDQRYLHILDVTTELGISRVALGHTADDLAETFLMHLVRGAGLRGLAFSFARKYRSVLLLRPLWQTPRSRILRYLEARRLPFREDESNTCLDFTRNRVRRVLIPLLEQEFNPAVRNSLRRASLVLGSAQRYISGIAERKVKFYLRQSGDPSVLPTRTFRRQPRALQEEVLRVWLRKALGPDARPLSEQIDAILRLVRSTRGKEVRLKGGTRIAKTPDALCIVDTPATLCPEHESGVSSDRLAFEDLARRHLEKNAAFPLAVLGHPIPLAEDKSGGWLEGEVQLLDGSRLAVRTRFLEQEQLPLGDEGKRGGIAFPISLRNRQPGDRVSASVRLKSVLINEKVPYFIRDFILLVVDGRNRILATIGLPRVTARIQRNCDQAVLVEIHPVG